MNSQDNILKNNTSGALTDRVSVSAPDLDLAKYRDFLPELGLSGEAGDDFLRELWALQLMFVHARMDLETIPQIFPEVFEDASGLDNVALDSSDEEICR